MTHPVSGFIRRLVVDQRARAQSDAELLRSFVVGHDETSFAALLHRHGRMVYDVCRSVMSCEADADDAFQATFLVLFRKASSVRKAASLGSWLHGVAYRTALRARTQAAKRRQHEALARKDEAAGTRDVSWSEVQQVLHEELSRLPKRYRDPLVVCYLEGSTVDTAAEDLAVAKGTLKRRLERARALLRARLEGRGLGPAALAVAVWPGATASAALPARVAAAIATTRRSLFGGGSGASPCPPLVQSLADRVIRDIFLSQLRVWLLLSVAVSTLGLGGALLAWQSGSGGPLPRAPEERFADESRDHEEQRLAGTVRQVVEALKRQPATPADDKDRLGVFVLELDQPSATLIAGQIDGRSYCGSPCWSHDGQRIVFDATPGKRFDQTRMQVFDVDDRGLHDSHLGPGNCPSFSPDGKQVAFLLNAGASPGEPAGIYVMNADGSQRRRICGGNGIPKWSPDGRFLLIAGFASPTPVSIVDVTTGDDRPVTIAGQRIYSVPSWAGPATMIVVVGSAAGPSIALVDVSKPESAAVKKTLWKIMDGPAVDPAYPVYSPAAKCSIFVGRAKSGQALYLLRQGKIAERLEPGKNDGRIASPAFSPDGRYLLFCSDRS